MKKKGMVIDIQVMLVLALVILVVMYLISGIFKDFAYKQSGIFGLVPGAQTLQITDSEDDLKTKVIVECNLKTAGYEYKIILDEVGFSYPSRNSVYPVFIFKGVTATALTGDMNEDVEIPGRLSFSSLPITSGNAPLESETVVLGFFKRSRDCFDIAKSGNLQSFVDKCARSMEAATSIVSDVKGCR